eukprot:8021932-Pyramimonas_sp.AAC.1
MQWRGAYEKRELVCVPPSFVSYPARHSQLHMVGSFVRRIVVAVVKVVVVVLVAAVVVAVVVAVAVAVAVA